MRLDILTSPSIPSIEKKLDFTIFAVYFFVHASIFKESEKI